MASSNYKEYYNKYAKKYYDDRSEGKIFINEYIEAPQIRRIVNEISRHKEDNAIDIGCGFGFYSRFLAEQNFLVTAIDVSSTMISLAKEYCRGLDNIKFINSRFFDIDFAEKKYKVVIGSFMLSYFNDLDELMTRIYDLLDTNAVLILSMLHPLVQNKVFRSDSGYVIESYFGEGFFKTNFLNSEELLDLKKWTLTNIFESCKKVNLFVENLYEPTPIPNNVMSKESFEFYSRLPAVVVFKIRKRAEA